MKKSLKFGLITASIYLVIAIVAFYIIPVSLGLQSLKIDLIPTAPAILVLISLLISIIGVLLSPYFFAVFGSSFAEEYCHPSSFVGCDNWSSFIGVVIINLLIYFFIGYLIGSFSDRHENQPAQKRIWIYTTIAVVVVLFFLIFKALFFS